MIYLGAIVLTALPYLLARILYFGELLPNSYYAKGGPGLDTVLSLILLQPAMLHRTIDVLSDVVGQPLAVWSFSQLSQRPHGLWLAGLGRGLIP